MDAKPCPRHRLWQGFFIPTVTSLRTITTDNGCEFAAHLEITRLLSMKNREKLSCTSLIHTAHGKRRH